VRLVSICGTLKAEARAYMEKVCSSTNEDNWADCFDGQEETMMNVLNRVKCLLLLCSFSSFLFCYFFFMFGFPVLVLRCRRTQLKGSRKANRRAVFTESNLHRVLVKQNGPVQVLVLRAYTMCWLLTGKPIPARAGRPLGALIVDYADKGERSEVLGSVELLKTNLMMYAHAKGSKMGGVPLQVT
jgi:hypothetical protein